MAVWPWPHFYFTLEQSSKRANEMAGKFKLPCFQYWFINLIFIYFSKRVGGSYCTWVLAQRNMIIFITDNSADTFDQFSVPQIEYPLGDSSKKRSHVYFLLPVFWVILLFCQIGLLFDINVADAATMVTWCHNSTICGYNSSTMATISRKYTWLHFWLLPPGVYSI